MDQQSTARLLGAIYFATCAGLSDEGVALANDLLYSIADQSPPADAHILRSIANSSVNSVEANYEQQPEYRRLSLQIIDGGRGMSNYFGKAPSSRPIRYQNLSYAGSASIPSTNFSAQTYQIRVVADLGGYFVIGDGTAVSCTAQSSSMKLNSNTDEEYFSVTPGQMCAFISTSTSTGNVSITEMS